jgi:diguanylate cyclase (GGDEF)-like protein
MMGAGLAALCDSDHCGGIVLGTSGPQRTPARRLEVFAATSHLTWMYLLAGVPFVTDLIEKGGLPESPREWITEVVAGAVILWLVRLVRSQHLAVVALARIDTLTGMGNRRAFEEAIADEYARARRWRQPLSLVYMDLDNFKSINDRDGHERGDLVLEQLGSVIRAEVRARLDHGFRLGGDEFALLLPGSTAAQAQAVLARIVQHCTRLDQVWVDSPLGISAGIAELAESETARDFVRRADAAMYETKQMRAKDADDLRGSV